MNRVSLDVAGTTPMFEGADWSYEKLQTVYGEISEIAVTELGLDIYPNQIEVISAEQMLDAYSSTGMPLMYRHWSFGKHFARDDALYRKGYQALAYEIVINSDPCISYIMEENSMTMQTLVIAHAAFGHNHFFRNNHLFRQWTDASSILDYLQYARNFVAECEEKHGAREVEIMLDAAHSLRDNGVDRYPRHHSQENGTTRNERRRRHEEMTYNDLWRTLPAGPGAVERFASEINSRIQDQLGLPEVNILHFLAQHAPKLEEWQREILDIVQHVAQYFYPQKQTKVMNEGCATWTHYTIMGRLWEKGLLTEGAMLEFMHAHSQVVAQPGYDDPRYSGINPYALGFAMMQDICRICREPTDEDRRWFPAIAGKGDAVAVLRDAWANYRDESFIMQFLSPKLMRDFRFFTVSDNSRRPWIEVEAIHDDSGYRDVRRALSAQYSLAVTDLDIQVTNVNLDGDRVMELTHYMHDGVPLEEKEARRVLASIAALWGYGVRLRCISPGNAGESPALDISA